MGKRDLQRGPEVIFLTGKPDVARPKTTICPIIPQGKVKVLSLRTRKYALQAIIVIVFLRICSLAGSLLAITEYCADYPGTMQGVANSLLHRRGQHHRRIRIPINRQQQQNRRRSKVAQARRSPETTP